MRRTGDSGIRGFGDSVSFGQAQKRVNGFEMFRWIEA
jgi:hypothetical protein